jgi:hypothetical protein
MSRAKDIPRDENIFDTIRQMRAPKTETETGPVVVGRYDGFGDPDNDPGTDEMSPPFLNGWENVTGSVTTFRVNEIGKIEVAAIVKNGTVGDPVFVLPVGYRPSHVVRFVQATTSTQLAIVEVRTNGEVVIIREITLP